jgi:integrase
MSEAERGKGKRANGEGSVYHVSNGDFWRAAITLDDGRRLSRKAKTEREANRLLRQMQAEREQGRLITQRMTVATFIERWLENTARQRVRPSTFECYQHKLKTHILPTLGRVQLSKLTPDHLRALYRDKIGPRSEGKVSPTTMKTTHVILRNALEQAYRDGVVARNVADLVTPPKKAPFRPKPLTQDEALALLIAVRGHRHGTLWTFMLGTGARFGEAVALRWQDIDLDRRTVHIRHTLARPLVRPGVRTWKLEPPKTDKSERVLSLPAFVVEALREQQTRTKEMRLVAGQGWQDHGFVFPNDRGDPLRENHVLERWHVMLRKAGIPARRMHDLRGSAGSLLWADGTELRAIGDLLGHSSLKITSDQYTARASQRLRQLADRLDAILASQPPAEAI